ncbi:MAG TPA: PQQ-binding-like beta-propeller repeat protein [Thermoguttaceae bacterium]|nr:PQQ-binding-like beta-propeller repeat protein [Thermoguttaceae bacterium]
MSGTRKLELFGMAAALMMSLGTAAAAAEDWLQLKYDCRHSGDVPDRALELPLGLLGAVPLTDAVTTAPVVADGRVYAVDASGVAFCIDAESLEVVWKVATPGAAANCSNVSSPALVEGYLHFGTTAGSYFVLRAADGGVVKEVRCGEPIFSAPVAGNGRVYFATLGSRVYALEPDGTVAWSWDFVKEVMGFDGDRWSGQAWLEHKQGRVTWRDTFCCSTDIALFDKTVVVPAGGRTVWLEDGGSGPKLRAMGLVPAYAGSEYPATFGQSIGEDGAVYRQWHRRDNSGRVEIFRLLDDGRLETDFVPGTQTAISLPGLMSFCSVSVREGDVYRCRPEEGFGLCRHTAGRDEPQCLDGYPSIVPPILLRDQAVCGGLDGRLYVVPLSGPGKSWSFATAFGCPISAPACVCDGRVYFGCEDGYLYVLGPGGDRPLPSKDLEVWKIRHGLSSKLADAKYDWYTNFGDLACTNANDQDVEPPFRIKWIRRYEGTFKHLPVCGGGRMYTHTAEGQIFAVEQETGRLLWRRYWPGVYLSFTSPIYYRERLLLPQAGMKRSRLRCLDAGTGKLLWEAPFTGSPSWSRQQPPVVFENLAIYMFGSGKYAPQGSAPPFVFKGTPVEAPEGEEIMSWIYTHDNPFYPSDNRSLIRAWDIDTGEEVWRQDFSEFGCGGNDSGLCLMDGRLYYSTFFGYAARRGDEPGPKGLTAALDPATGKVLWSTTDYYVTAGCTISGRDGRLYLGGYNRPDETTEDRFVWCLDARDGSLVWRSEPLASAVNVISVGREHLFTNASGKDGYVLDRQTGKIVSRFNFGYACTRFALSEPYAMGANMDLIDLSDGNKLVTTGPAVDSRECVGAVVSNGRIFYTSQASGLQVSQTYGAEAAGSASPWGKAVAR